MNKKTIFFSTTVIAFFSFLFFMQNRVGQSEEQSKDFILVKEYRAKEYKEPIIFEKGTKIGEICQEIFEYFNNVEYWYKDKKIFVVKDFNIKIYEDITIKNF